MVHGYGLIAALSVNVSLRRHKFNGAAVFYIASTAGADTRAIRAYIQNQLAEDQALDQMTFKEYIDPFTGSKNTQA